jgi:hypothetical protein
MHRSTEESLVTSADQERRSNVVDLNAYRRLRATKRIAPKASDWPMNLQIAWDLTH